MRLNDAATPGWTWRALGCGAAAVVVLYLAGVMIAGLLAPLRGVRNSVVCQSNVFRLTRACRMYAEDYDDRLPPAERWMDGTFFYITEERYLHCPEVSKPGENIFGYSLNAAVAGKVRGKIETPEQIPMIFDSNLLFRSASGTISSMPNPGRHRTKPSRGSPSKPGNYVGYGDGSARIVLDTSK
jgi:hypothetical protein